MGSSVLMLTEPYGYGTGDAVSLWRQPSIWPKPLNVLAMTRILESHSCYPPAVPKVISCLQASNRYDCVLQTGWFRQHAVDLAQELQEVGVRIRVTSLSTLHPALKPHVLKLWKQVRLL